jgi:phospholipid-transporting ATPase
MEVVKFQQSILINSDLDMYHPATDTPALCRTSSLVEELGQIEYVFSDKTGTLTRNEMEFRACSVAGVAYSEVVDESKKDEVDAISFDGAGLGAGGGYRTFQELREILSGGAPRSNNPFADPASISGGAPGLDQERAVMKEFLTLLAVCHTVIPEIGKGGKMVYQASSPDEAALVAGAELLGYQFTVSC